MKKTTLFLALVLLFAACSSEGPAGSGSIDGVDLGLNLELHLEDLVRTESPSADDLEIIQNLIPSAPSLDSVRFYTAVAMGDEDLDSYRIATVPLSGSLEGGRAAVAVSDDGAVKRFRVWDIADERADWENFWRQFEYKNTRQTLALSPAVSDSAAMDYMDELIGSEDRAVWSAYRHIVLMRDNSQAVRTTMAITSGGNTPDPQLYARFINNLNELNEIATSLEPVIGSSATMEYSNVVETGVSALNALSALAEENKTAGVRNAISDYRRKTCGACHGITEHDLGDGDLDDNVLAYFKSIGADRDWYRVGLDVWAVPGEEAASQELASALKSMLILMHR